jgi:hypothetical protein
MKQARKNALMYGNMDGKGCNGEAKFAYADLNGASLGSRSMQPLKSSACATDSFHNNRLLQHGF